MTKLKRKTLKKVSKQLAKASKMHAGQSKKIGKLANMMQKGGQSLPVDLLNSNFYKGQTLPTTNSKEAFSQKDNDLANLTAELRVMKEKLRNESKGLDRKSLEKRNAEIINLENTIKGIEQQRLSTEISGGTGLRPLGGESFKNGGYPKSDKNDFMKRMGYYQAGGLGASPMYGANTMPGAPETAAITYTEADPAKLKALEDKLKEAQESTKYMDEAQAEIAAQESKIAGIEKGVGTTGKALTGDTLKNEAGETLGDRLGLDKILQTGPDRFLSQTERATKALKAGKIDKFMRIADKANKGVDKFANVGQDALGKGLSLTQTPASSSLNFATKLTPPPSILPTGSLPSSLTSFSTPTLTTTPLSQLGTTASTSLANPALGQQGANLLNTGATAGASASKGLIGGVGTGGVGAIASLAGEGIKMASDDQDATTMNTGETIGSGLSGIGTGIGAAMTTAALMGSTLGPVGTAAGVVGGAIYGLGKGLIQRGKARKEEGKAEAKKEQQLARIGAKKRTEEMKSKEYSGFDFGSDVAKYGGYYQMGGVQLPGGVAKPIPGSDAIEFKGKSHAQGGIMVDPMTEVEGDETMDKVTMKNGGKNDYFFSQHLKLGGKSFAQRHKDILKNGGSQKNIDQLAKLQEEKAGRDPNVVKLGAGGYKTYQGDQPGYSNFLDPSFGINDVLGNTIQSDLNQDSLDDASQGVTNYVQRPQPELTREELTREEKNHQNMLDKGFVFDETTGTYKKPKPKPKPTNTTANTTNTKPKPKEREKFNYEAIPMKTITELPTDMYNNNSLPGILPYTDGTYPNVSDEIQKDLTLEEQNLIDKANSDRELTDAEERALRKIYKAVPNEALVAAGAQLIPAIYALSRKDAPAEQMSAPGRLKGPQLDRVSYNTERAANAADNRAINRFIETSGVGPAGIIAKMASYRRKQEGDMKIAAQESRANIAIANQEAQMQQQAEARNVANRLRVDQINTAAREAERVAQINRKQEAIDVLGQGIAGTAGDVMSYKANERLAMATGDMGIYERDRLRTFLKGQINPDTGKPYTNSDIAAIFNKQFKDPVATKEDKEDKEDK